jgi:hypothetical protein
MQTCLSSQEVIYYFSHCILLLQVLPESYIHITAGPHSFTHANAKLLKSDLGMTGHSNELSCVQVN